MQHRLRFTPFICAIALTLAIDIHAELPLLPPFSPLPDGSPDASTGKMLKEVGRWMTINGDWIYGSIAWTKLGEGSDGKLNVLPGGKIGRKQADHKFAPQYFRFTVGKDGALYAYCMTVPAPGTELKITSLGNPVKSVKILGQNDASLKRKQQDDGLVITCPDTMPFASAIGFRIE
ncbi:MAG: hypothetical protein ABI600_08450 [Luteolibacter sp.]